MSVPAFIDLTESDQIIQLREYLTSHQVEIKEEPKNDLIQDVKDIIIGSNSIWKDQDAKDIEGIVNSILSLLFMIPIENGEELVSLLCDQLYNGAVNGGKAGLSVKLVHNLFHGYPIKTPFLYKVLSTWYKVGGETRSSANVIPKDLKKVEEWCNDWGVTREEKQALLRLLYDLQCNVGNINEASKVMIALLEGYGGENAEQAAEDARKYIIRSLADSKTYLYDEVLSLKAVMALKGEDIYQLLTIFVDGNLQDYVKFHQDHQDAISSWGLSHESNLRKMQLLTLIDLIGSSHEISFECIQEKLDVTPDAIEEFIIDALHSKLIRGKIDHYNKKLLVSQASPRVFGRQQWQVLAERLSRWRNDIAKVSDKLESVRIMA